eukprot:Phypoly_transcript_03693.p1 GENE.Phypoly_transcript_03693~~Phypoly_transcript_03693.p1  ORF type:complete len:746 (-),score=175.11 Phypoly_transcript_03693:42-2279(-)
MDHEKFLLGNDHDAPTSAEEQNSIEALTREFEGAISAPHVQTNPTPLQQPVTYTYATPPKIQVAVQPPMSQAKLPAQIPQQPITYTHSNTTAPQHADTHHATPTNPSQPSAPHPTPANQAVDTTKFKEYYKGYLEKKVTREDFINVVVQTYGKPKATELLTLIDSKQQQLLQQQQQQLLQQQQQPQGQHTTPQQHPTPQQGQHTTPQQQHALQQQFQQQQQQKLQPQTTPGQPTPQSNLQRPVMQQLPQHMQARTTQLPQGVQQVTPQMTTQAASAFQIKMGQAPPPAGARVAPGTPVAVPTQGASPVTPQRMVGVPGQPIAGAGVVGGMGGIGMVNVGAQQQMGNRPPVPVAGTPKIAATTGKKGKGAAGGEDENMADSEKPSIKDLNDVTKIAGVDIRAEEEHSLSDLPEDQNQHGVKEVEPVLLNVNPLKKKIGGIAVQQGMKSIHEGVYEYINIAVSEHLRTILASLVRVSDHRLEVHKDELPFTVTSEPRKILAAIEKKERDERARKEAEEKERLIKEAKQQENALKKKQAAGDDKVNQAQREKLSKLRLEEEERQRTSAANVTALQAIGDIRSKPKPQPPPAAPGAPAGAAPAGAPGATPATVSPVATPQRATPVAIPPQGIHIVLPGGQSYTFTRTHLAHLQRLNTMHHQGQALTVEQRQMMTTLYSQYTYIQKLHTQQQQQLANAQAAVNPMLASGDSKKSQRKIVLKDCMFIQKQIGARAMHNYELKKMKRKYGQK